MSLPPREESLSPVEIVALAYLGFEAAYPRASLEIGPVSIGVLIALGVAVRGWGAQTAGPSVKRYLPWAAALAACGVLSAVAAWDASALYSAATLTAWLVVIIPGLANRLTDRRRLNAVLLGLCAGVSVFIGAVAWRLLRGESALDVVAGTTSTSAIWSINRNAVNARVALVLPFLLIAVGPTVVRRLRFVLIGLSVLLVLNGAGRTGLIGLFVIGFALALLQPGASSRLRMLLGALLVGLFMVGFLQTTAGDSSKGFDRLLNYVNGERSDDDRARELLLRKAWNIALDHPFFGAGLGRFSTTYHPVIEEASNTRVRDIAASSQEHNTYAEIMSETGFIGFFSFLGLLAALMRMGVSELGDRYARAATCALVGMSFMVFFSSALSAVLFFPMAIVLATSAASGRPEGLVVPVSPTAPEDLQSTSR